MLEKPLGRSLKECDEIITSTESVSKLHVGFNYRFYDGINAALRDAKNGVFGKLISVKFTLAHGNAPGMEKSWKLNKDRCGGGCLIDPGVHILDLMLLLSSGTLKIDGMSKWSGFWNTGIEEEVHLLLSDEMQTIFTADISLNRWRSKFSMELNGLEGYGVVEGRGRSYGPQSYRRGKRWGWQSGVNQSDSEELIIGSHAADNSFYNETKQLLGFEVSGSDNTIRVSDAVSSRRVMDLLERIKSQIS